MKKIIKCSRTIVRSETIHLNENCVNLKTHKIIWHGQVNDIMISNNRFFVLLIANKWVILVYNCPTPVLDLIYKAQRLEFSFKAFKLYFLDLLCISQCPSNNFTIHTQNILHRGTRLSRYAINTLKFQFVFSSLII